MFNFIHDKSTFLQIQTSFRTDTQTIIVNITPFSELFSGTGSYFLNVLHDFLLSWVQDAVFNANNGNAGEKHERTNSKVGEAYR